MEIIELNEAAILLKMSPETLRRKAQTGEVPAAKPGKQWIFIPDDLFSYIRSEYKVENNFYLTNSNGDNTCNTVKKKIPHLPRGDYMAQRKVEKVYKELMMSKKVKPH